MENQMNYIQIENIIKGLYSDEKYFEQHKKAMLEKFLEANPQQILSWALFFSGFQGEEFELLEKCGKKSNYRYIDQTIFNQIDRDMEARKIIIDFFMMYKPLPVLEIEDELSQFIFKLAKGRFRVFEYDSLVKAYFGKIYGYDAQLVTTEVIFRQVYGLWYKCNKFVYPKFFEEKCLELSLVIQSNTDIWDSIWYILCRLGDFATNGKDYKILFENIEIYRTVDDLYSRGLVDQDQSLIYDEFHNHLQSFKKLVKLGFL